MKLRSEKDHIRDYEEQGEKADPVQVHHGMTPKRSPEQELFRAARQNSDKIAKWGLHFWEQEQFLVLTLRVQVLGQRRCKRPVERGWKSGKILIFLPLTSFLSPLYRV